MSVSRTYVPNEYVVWLSPEDRARYEGVEREVADELAAYLLEHARRERLALVSRPAITSRPTSGSRSGSSASRPGSSASPTRARDAAASVQQGDHGHTMVYSSAARVQEELQTDRAARRGAVPPRAFVVAEGKRMSVPPWVR